MSMMTPAAMALATVAMMVAMMLPSIAPTVWRHHRHLRAARVSRAAQRTMLFTAGYASIWAAVGVALFACSAGLSPVGMPSLTDPPFARRATAAIVVGAGALQCSRWKVKHLLRCRQSCVPGSVAPRQVITAWRDGCQLGIHCALSCAAPMAVLLAAGLMNTRMMLVAAAAITAERVAPAGARIALVTGALAILAGSVMFLTV